MNPLGNCNQTGQQGTLLGRKGTLLNTGGIERGHLAEGEFEPRMCMPGNWASLQQPCGMDTVERQEMLIHVCSICSTHPATSGPDSGPI